MSTVFMKLRFKDQEAIPVFGVSESIVGQSLTPAERIEENHPL
jgi:hypothetical protein